MDANKLKDLRKKLGLTQKELAEELGVLTNTLARWEQGERAPSRSSLTLLKELEKRYLRVFREMTRKVSVGRTSTMTSHSND